MIPFKSPTTIKLISLMAMVFCILLVYNSIRVLKDSLLVNNLGVEAISFIKLWFEIPIGFILVVIYCKLCNVLSAAVIFRLFVCSFLLFFTLFAFVIYPNQEFFHPNQANVDNLILLHSNFKWFFILWSKWSFTAFYILSEFWPVIVYSLLFWQLANSAVTTDEAKIFYPYISMVGQLNLILCGVIIFHFTGKNNVFCFMFSDQLEETELCLKSIVLATDILGFLILVIHYLLTQNIQKHGKIINSQNTLLKLSLKDSFIQIITSRYLFLICMIALLYHMCAILIEGLWFSKVQEFYKTTNQFMQYQSRVLFWTGVSGLFFAIVGKIVLTKYNWYKASVITPSLALIFGLTFLALVTFNDQLMTFFSYSVLNLLGLIVFSGAIQNVVIKGAKYGICDPAKELLFIPLDKEMKAKGKAAVEVLGTKLGKSLGSVMQFSIFTIFPSTKMNDIAGILLIIFLCVTILWLITVKKLSILYEKKLPLI